MPAPDSPFIIIYLRLLQHWGPQYWWPVIHQDRVNYLREPQPLPRTAEHQWHIVLGAILTQNTAWSNAARALENLWQACRADPGVIQAMPDERLENLLHPTGYYRQKALKVRSWLRHYPGGDLSDKLDLPDPDLRREVLSVWGIGPETADSILLYALGRGFFVVDAYTRRILGRTGLLDPELSYEAVRSCIEDGLPRDIRIYQEYHALLVKHARNICRKNSPECPVCCLRTVCRYANS